jgi:hypothetical protein
MLSGGIIVCPLNRPDSALTGDSALQLRAHFVAGSFFEGIGAASRQQKNRGQ